MLLRSSHVASGDPLPFEFKGSLFTLTVLHLFNLDRKAIERHLAEKIKQAPSFFNNTPVVIDLDGLADPKEGGGGDLKGLYDLLRGHGMIPVGIRNGGPKLQAAARLTGIPVLPENRAAAKKPEPPEPGGPRTRIVNHPVRSGQEIYAPDGDLVVLGAVSAGADVVADGNIHVYGALRGRALAGVKGDVEAWIFCQSLEAQLVSIAGRYRLSDQLDASGLNKAVQIHLKEERLIIERLAR